MQSKGDFYIDAGGLSDSLKGLADYGDELQKKKKQAEAEAGLADWLASQQEAPDSYMGGTEPVGQGMGAFPVDSSKPSFKARQELHPDALHEDNLTLQDLMDPMHTQQERMALDEIGITPDKHEEVAAFGDKFKNASDEELGGLIKDRVAAIVDRGGDASHTASLMGMDPETARAHVNAVRTLAKRDAIRRMAMNDPQMAYKIMQDEQASRKAELAAQKEARLMDQNDRNLAMQEKRLNAPSYGAITQLQGPDGNAVLVALDNKTGKPVIVNPDAKLRPSGSGGASQSNPADDDNLVQAVLSHDLDVSKLDRGSKNRIMSKVYAQDKDFNEGETATQARSRNDFISGQSGQKIRSLNASFEHLDTLKDLADAMGSNNPKTINKLFNTVSTEFGGVDVNNFDAARGIVSAEIVNSVVKSGGTEAERDDAKRILESSKTPEQLKGAIQTVKTLFNGQAGALDQQWKSSGNKGDFKDRFLQSKAKENYERYLQNKSGGSAASGGANIQDRIAAMKAKRNASK